jgi:hypothetical protein
MILLPPLLLTTLMTEITRSFETVLFYENTQHQFPEEEILNLENALVEKVFEMGLR